MYLMLKTKGPEKTGRTRMTTRPAVRPNRKRSNPAALADLRIPAAKLAWFTATDAKSDFGQVLEKAIQGGIVVITKHDVPKAVFLSLGEFRALSSASEARINTLSADFDSLLAQMQGKATRKSMYAAFHASPDKLGQAAVAAAVAAAKTRG